MVDRNGMRPKAIPMEELVPLLELQLSQGGCANLVVTGSSMLPMLHHRKDQVLLEPVTGEIKKGALLLYRRREGKYILHRVLRVKGQTLICCGDNQWEKETVQTDQVIAQVSAFTRNGKQYRINNKGYRLYVWLWVGLHPVRRAILPLRRFAGRLRRRMKVSR